jgi:L-rhamnose mutarotase
MIKLKPGRISEYVELHAAVWPGVKAKIDECNIRNYSIYLKDEALFAYFEYAGANFEEDMAKMAADPIIQKWWDACKPCMLPIETRKEGEWWANMEEIFHQD